MLADGTIAYQLVYVSTKLWPLFLRLCSFVNNGI